ncbi:MAG: glycosyltransferase [Ignavibacteriales bacterium]
MNTVIQVLPEGVRYLLAGKTDLAYLGELQTLEKWPQVDLPGSIPFEKVGDVFAKTDICLVLCDYLSGDPSRRGTQGSRKLFEYVRAGLTVLCTDFVPWEGIVEGNRCGMCANPQDSCGISNAISDLMQNPARSSEMGENGQKAVLGKHDWSLEEKRLMALYDAVLGEGE